MDELVGLHVVLVDFCVAHSIVVVLAVTMHIQQGRCHSWEQCSSFSADDSSSYSSKTTVAASGMTLVVVLFSESWWTPAESSSPPGGMILLHVE
jgi:hypothetical protein